MVSRASGTADTPRAHITNMAALECLRDIGVDKDCLQVATEGECMKHTRWCHSMAGEEFARIYSWGNDPARKGDYEIASPCEPCDLPQTFLEPVLVNHATHNGFKCRWDTSFVSFQDLGKEKGVITRLRDDVTGQEYSVRSKYLFGADGARSRVVKQLELPLNSKPGGGVALNVLVRADLSSLIKHRKGNLHWVLQPDRPHCVFGRMAIVRMVKPWYEWMFILLPKPGWDGPEPTRDQYLDQVKAFIGDDAIPAEILSISKWVINETVAEQYSQGDVFCLGDAVHRHPPFNGLGSNTCIQDAFNLAWKIAYVESGHASRSLLDSYSIERQPVGHTVVTRANEGFREHEKVWRAIGILPEDISERRTILEELQSPGPVGRRRRAALQAATLNTCHEFHGLGVEMNQFYAGDGIYTADEKIPFRLQGPAAEDPILYHMRSTYPGRRLPHTWLNKRKPSQQPISTIDLAGHGSFTIFTGLGGDAWRSAATEVMKKLASGLQINVYSIGPGEDWEDVYYEWAKVREVEDDGAILVRPDRFVAWRCLEAISSDDSGCEAKLLHVMRSVLGL
jgi:2-polyprenyl-6-methoxyphenol hydroxylase-like FAD-dependent oxidoreductase